MPENSGQPTYKRQRFLLAFIRQFQDYVAPTDLQKLVFLHTMDGNSEFYEFIPYKFGAYSFQLAEDVDILRRDGYLTADNKQIKAIGTYPQDIFLQIATERGDNLIRKAYREHPYYAINSEIIDRIFAGHEAESFKNAKKNCAQTGQTLFTIGYEGKSIEAFANILIKNDIRLLCDVRKNPLSRKFGFSKAKLKHIMETVGIKYTHMPDLGIESDKRTSLDTPEDYRRLFGEYAKTLPGLKPQLESLYKLLRTNERIAIMCYELEPHMCHRHVIRDHIAKLYPIRSTDL